MAAFLIVLLVAFAVLIVLGIPIVFAIGSSSILALLVNGDLPLVLIPQRIFNSLNSFTLLAIPFFILAGNLMLQGGISKRLIELAKSLLRPARYHLAYVTVAASAFFGAISGSAPATTAAIGSMMYPEMTKEGYDADFSAFLGAISGTLGLLIPPSIAMVVFGMQTGTSVTKLFIVGGVAGLILSIVYCLAAKISMRKNITIQKGEKIRWGETWIAFKGAFWGLLAPIIILGGIYSGIFTPTEAACIAVIYSLIVGAFIYKELDLKKIIKCTIDAALTSGMVLLLVGVAALFSWILTVGNAGTIIKNFVLSFISSPAVFMIVVNIIYLFLGMIMETIPIITLTSPIFLPIAIALGIDPVFFGAITVINLAFGIITPPFGINLFVAAGYSQRGITGMVKRGRWLFLFGITMIFILSLFPQIIMWIV
jgi:C4-dicarboxylate transporter DctM subunit